ncbi:hypothetical protein D3C71_912870 [compost metagenome]
MLLTRTADLCLSSLSSRAVIALLSKEGDFNHTSNRDFLSFSFSFSLCKKKEPQRNEKQNENEEQKESLDKTAKALSFCGESGSGVEPEMIAD